MFQPYIITHYSKPKLEHWEVMITIGGTVISHCCRFLNRVLKLYNIEKNIYSLIQCNKTRVLRDNAYNRRASNTSLPTVSWQVVHTLQCINHISSLSSIVPKLDYWEVLISIAKTVISYCARILTRWSHFTIYQLYIVILFKCTKTGVLRGAG